MLSPGTQALHALHHVNCFQCLWQVMQVYPTPQGEGLSCRIFPPLFSSCSHFYGGPKMCKVGESLSPEGVDISTLSSYFFVSFIALMIIHSMCIHIAKTTFGNGFLGSRNDEERSEMRYVSWIAELWMINIWTHIAPAFLAGMSFWDVINVIIPQHWYTLPYRGWGQLMGLTLLFLGGVALRKWFL